METRKFILDGFDKAEFMTEWLSLRQGFNELLENKPDGKEFALRRREVKYFAGADHGCDF